MGNGNMFEMANQANLDAARIAFHVAFMQALEAGEADPAEILARELPSTTSMEELDWLGDLPGMTEWKGDREIADLAAFKMQIRNRDWASGLAIHQNNFKDDKLGLLQPLGPEMARIARAHRADLQVQTLLNGFTGSDFPEAGNGLAYDGALFFSDSHQVGNGPAQSNKLTSALSASSLAQARQKLRQMKTADGKRPLGLYGTHLVVGPKLEDLAVQLLKADVVPNTAGTATQTNTNKNKYELIVSPRIVDTFDDYWFLADLRSAMFRPVIFQLREEISTSAILGNQGGSNDSTQRFMKGKVLFGAEARYNTALFSWQTIIGSAVA